MGRRFRGKYGAVFAALMSAVLISLAVFVPAQKPAEATLNPQALLKIAQTMSDTYYWLAWDKAGQGAVNTARGNLAGVTVSEIQNLLWPSPPPAGGYLVPLSNGVTGQQASQLLYDLFNVTLSGTNGFFNSQNINNLYRDVGTVTALLSNANLPDLYTFFTDAQSYGISQQLNGGTTLQTILTSNGTTNPLSNAQVQSILSSAMQYVGTHPGQDGIGVHDGTVYSELTGVRWTIPNLVSAELAIDQFNPGSGVVDPNYAAEIALLKAYTRSQAHLSIATLSPGAEETVDVQRGVSNTATITVAGTNITSALTVVASDPSVTITNSGGQLTISDDGTPPQPVEITAYYQDQNTDWVYKGLISAPAPSGGVAPGGSGRSVTTSIAISPTSLPDGSIGQPYSATLSATGGTSPYSFAVTSGSLPDGLNLSSAGVLSGTPTKPGNSNFTVTATDAVHNTGSNSYKLLVRPAAPPVTKPVTVPQDVIGNWAQQYIVALLNAGVVTGYPDGNFYPDRYVTRAEFATMLVKAVGIQPLSDYSDLQQFQDYGSIPDWAKPYLAAAVKAKLLNGVAQDGVLVMAADQDMTRVEVGAAMGREFPNVTPAPLTFTDAASIPSWAVHDLGVALAKGIISGYPDGTFQPLKDITRAEAAAMIDKLMQSL